MAAMLAEAYDAGMTARHLRFINRSPLIRLSLEEPSRAELCRSGLDFPARAT